MLSKCLVLVVCLMTMISISSLLFAENQNTFLSEKIHKETKEEYDRNININLMAYFSDNILGRKLISVVAPTYIEKIYVPYKTEITPKQISYLFQHAVFKKYEDLPTTHLLPTGTFNILLKNQIFLVFHTYMGASMIRVTHGLNTYCLEIPDHETFYVLGSKKEIKKQST